MLDEHLLYRENGTKAAQELPLAEDVSRHLAGYDTVFSPCLADGAEAKLLEGRTTSAAARTPPATTVMEAWVALRTASRSLRPTAFAMTTLDPERNAHEEVDDQAHDGRIGTHRGHAQLPASPEKWPIMTTSMRLESCSRMLVAATGSAKRGLAPQNGPPGKSGRALGVPLKERPLATC